LYGSLAGFAQEEPLQAFRDGEILTLVPAAKAGSARLELPGGRMLELALPNRAQVSSLAFTDAGWVAAGSVSEERGNQRLFLLTGNDKAAQPLPEPPGQKGAIRRKPILLVDGGRLAGLAWLEGNGDRSLAVRAAVWNGRRWQAPQAVSHPGPGSQLALTGGVLADGSWLLAWSAFDGTADEIVWSRRQGGQWLAAKRVSAPNAVPDITPALTATSGGGALLAWSRYDGNSYQLRMARFEGGEWRGERPAGPSGSLYPAFVGGADHPRLLYLDAAPREWTLLDLDSQGRVKAKGSVSAVSLDRPAVTLGNGEVRMRWPSLERPSLEREIAARLERVP
jgi:hypothetical protein